MKEFYAYIYIYSYISHTLHWSSITIREAFRKSISEGEGQFSRNNYRVDIGEDGKITVGDLMFKT